MAEPAVPPTSPSPSLALPQHQTVPSFFNAQEPDSPAATVAAPAGSELTATNAANRVNSRANRQAAKRLRRIWVGHRDNLAPRSGFVGLLRRTIPYTGGFCLLLVQDSGTTRIACASLRPSTCDSPSISIVIGPSNGWRSIITSSSPTAIPRPESQVSMSGLESETRTNRA